MSPIRGGPDPTLQKLAAAGPRHPLEETRVEERMERPARCWPGMTGEFGARSPNVARIRSTTNASRLSASNAIKTSALEPIT
jgi:hypothetical protein